MNISPKDVEEWTKEEMNWPQYYVNGEGVDEESFVPAYYRVDGPNGPIHYMNPGDDKIIPTTMLDFAMESQSDSFRRCEREETPWSDEVEFEPERYIPLKDVEEQIERFRERADKIEEHIGDSDEEIINQRNEWNVGTWRSMANELEAHLVRKYKDD